jgi:hypothetical protein
MSTQKRASRGIPATRNCREDLRHCRQRLSCTDRAGARPPIARYDCAVASRVTAPLRSAFWSIWARMATAFLQADQLPGQFARPSFAAELSGSPPLSACRSTARRFAVSGGPASPRSSLPPIPFPSGLARLHRNLPQDPAAYRRRAERYDGQRDLYFLHAA